MGRAQQQPNGKRRIHAEERHREEHQREGGHQAPKPNIIDRGEHRLEDGLSKARQCQEIDRSDDHRERQQRRGDGSVGERSAEKIARRQRDQHRGDQRRPGIDAAAEIRIEIARSEHLEAHDDCAGDEGHGVDRGAGGGIRRAWDRFDRGVLHEALGREKSGPV